jgi:hypothetical protein
MVTFCEVGWGAHAIVRNSAKQKSIRTAPVLIIVSNAEGVIARRDNTTLPPHGGARAKMEFPLIY